MRRINLSGVTSGRNSLKVLTLLIVTVFYTNFCNAQCDQPPGVISGAVMLDGSDKGIPNVLVKAYNTKGELATQAMSDFFGAYSLTGLVDGENMRIEFVYGGNYSPAIHTSEHATNVQFASVPTCEVNLALVDPANYCAENTQIALTCFVRGGDNVNDELETLVFTDYDFSLDSKPSKLSNKAMTGSIWGLTWKSSATTLYSSAFIKQYAGLTEHGHSAIFKTDVTTGTTELFTRLDELGQEVGTLVGLPMSMEYGSQVGKMGLGGLEISADEQTLYVVNLYNNTLVAMSSENPTAETTLSYSIPNPGCKNGDSYRAFALTKNNGKLYVGVTCTSFESGAAGELSTTVFEFDPETEAFSSIFSTDYPQGYWIDYPANSVKVQAWLTDLDFTDDGNMILSLSDRVAHRFANPITNGRLDDQHPDILIAYNDNGVWKLENNAQAGSLTGSHPNSNEGPGNGEFFGYDYWISGPDYHSEIATGSVMVLPGTGSVVATVFDPDFDSYTGGLHKYSTTNGDKLGVTIVYEHATDPLFGKASGLGDMVAMCASMPLEIGNLVWNDENNNGIQDAGEAGLSDIEVSIYDADCILVGTTTTNKEGNYYFNDSNVDLNQDGLFDGLNLQSNYTLVITDKAFDEALGNLNIGNETLNVTQKGTGSGTNPERNDSDAGIATGICDLFEGRPFISVRTGSNGETNHDYDFGFTPAGDLDLALRKELVSNYSVVYGDTALFKITVFNQGGITADEVAINDYLADGFSFDSDANAGWKLNGTIAQTILGSPLTPGSEASVYIKLVVNEGATASELINYAEIGLVLDADGEPIKDVDSTPDDIMDNDNGGVTGQPTDNELFDDGTIDEDDHDPASVGIYDLALLKELAEPGQAFLPNSTVEYEITVYNQGSITAKSVTISDYLPAELIFNPALNPEWELLDDSTIVYTITEEITPLSSDVVSLTLETGNLLKATDVVNYSEIRSSIDEFNEPGRDVDSQADGDRKNDSGGSPYDATDNKVNDDGTVDEDDHDPAMLSVEILDLALIKTTKSKSVKAGEDVVFKIEIINQGDIAAFQVGIVDYIPAEMKLNDPNWTVVDSEMAKFMLTIPGGLQPGERTSVEVNLTVSQDFLAGTIVNFAEIDQVYGMDGNDVSANDRDSKPDDLRSNDAGGRPFDPTDDQIDEGEFEDEDDHDPAYVYVFRSEVEETCVCLDNASETEAGQFGEIIEITAPSGLEWYIFQVDGLYDAGILGGSVPPVGSDFTPGSTYTLTPFVTGDAGYMLDEFPIGTTGNSQYFVTGIRGDGEDYRIVLRNNVGDQEIIEGAACNYETNNFLAPAGVCLDMTAEFCVTDYNSSATNLWTITSEGASEIIGEDDQACVTIMFAGAVGDEVDIVFDSNSAATCYSPAMQTVTIGAAGGSLSCIANVNVSLDNLCEVSLEPASLLSSEITTDAVYSVVYTTVEGSMLPSDVEWKNYIGREVVAKVMDNCSGNSCWSFVYLEDKTAPEIECFDITVSCVEMLDYIGPFVLDNCSGEGVLIPTTQSNETLECDPDFSHILTRGYKAQDEQGNMTDECMQKITIKRVDLDLIVAPENYTVENSTALACTGFDTIAGGVPDPATYGSPTLEGQQLYPSGGRFCAIAVQYKDTFFPPNGCVQKIMRQWFIYDWTCDFIDVDTIVQIFNIADMAPPTIACISDMKVSTNGATCLGDVNLPAATVSDDCTSLPRVDITYPGGFLENSNGGVIQLPIGTHQVTYTVYDDCSNFTTCDVTVVVEDNTAPIAICDNNTVVSLRNDGSTYALASSFDDGSYDDCGFASIEVRRMDGGDACGEDDRGVFSDRVHFCCADVGEETLVVLRVFDVSGNANQCMVNVQVQDKNPPSIVAPRDTIIDCAQDINLEDLSKFGVASAKDNCKNPTIVETVFSGLNECRTGKITRTFTATDASGTTAVDVQTITVINEETFDISNIQWPLDFETSAQCDPRSLEPENLPTANAFPILDVRFCTEVGVTYSDKVFQFLNGGSTCQKIIRSWLVEDFCQPLTDGHYARWRWDQVIEISNDVAPLFTSGCEDVTVCSFNENCATGPITLTASATDDCTPDDMMRYNYLIDFDDNGGAADIQDFGSGGTVTVMGEYPIGTHRITYIFWDLCGNSTTCSQLFTIENCVGPTVVCHDGISVALIAMDTNGDGDLDDEMAVVCADVFDASSFHPCGEDLIFSFSEDPTDICRTFACDDIGFIELDIYAMDEDGNLDFCTTTLEVQDNNDVDLCRGVEECIVMPTDMTVRECVADLSPEVIGGGPTIDPDCICTQTTIDFVDRDSTVVDNSCRIVIRDWTVTFLCGSPKSFVSTQIITKFNDSAPVVQCPDGVTVNAGANCEGEVIVGLPQVLSDCTTEFTITNDSEFANTPNGSLNGTYPVGIDTSNYIITDVCGNMATCEMIISVTDDEVPICETNDITIAITDELVDITVSADDIDNGSSDACGLVVERVLSPSVFGCDDAGFVQDVTLTITDDSGNFTQCFSTVTVVDSVAPVCDTRTTTIILLDDASVTVPAIAINNDSYDECGELVTIMSNSSFNCEDLGQAIAVLILIDDSGNRTECEVEITVSDEGPPICILQDITVQLDGSDQATISAVDIDNGSFDNCSGLDSLILDQTSFTCDDIGPNTVNVIAIDSAGNEALCDAIVTVESDGALMCIADDITIFLGDDGAASITVDDVDGGSGIPCADDAVLSLSRTMFFCNDVAIPTAVTLSITSSLGDTSCVAMIMVIDTIPPVVVCPANVTVNCEDLSEDLSVYGTINTTGSNCVVLPQDISVVASPNLNVCGLGDIERTFTAIGINGNSNTCTQVITVTNDGAFSEDDVTWPTDTLTIVQCTSIHPDSINSNPVINVSTESCANIGVSFVDDNFTMSTTCQDSIRRTWTVTDSCATPFTVVTFDQIIVVSDELAPIVIAEDSLLLCDTLVAYTFEVTDCNDVTVDFSSAAGSGTGTTITGIFPEGSTTVNIVATDRCGNTSIDSVIVNIVLDTLPPLITCINRTIRIEEDGETQVLPSDGNWFFRVSDNTTDSSSLMYSFDPDFDMTNDTLLYTCDSVIIKSHSVRIYVKDKGGNVSTCDASYVTTDPLGVCAGNLAVIQGIILTEDGQQIPEVRIDLMNGNMSEMTNSEGFYTFPEMEGGSSYELMPEKDTDHMAGVTSLDLVLIQRHILGTRKLSSAYQLIAADVNKSGEITGRDLLDIKKNILSLIDRFPNNKSWRFVDEAYNFIDVSNPLIEDFPESHAIYEMNGSVYKNFVGIKVGDVNGSVQLGSRGTAGVRSAPLVMEAEDRILAEGEEVSIPLVANESIDVAGFQFSFVLDRSMVLQGVESDLFEISNADYSVADVNGEQVLTMVIIPSSDIELDKGMEVLRVKLVPTSTVQLSKDFYMDGSFKNELYGSDLTVHNVSLRYGELDLPSADDVLLQNTPNPWKDKTAISFSLMKNQQATINIYAVTGALVSTITGDFTAGRNVVEVTGSQLKESGVYYYELVTDNSRISKRMILIK